MTAAPADDPMVPMLTDELHELLTRERLVEGVNLLLTHQNDWLLIQIMAISTGRLGVLLARYPIDNSIVFLAKVRLPVSDLPEVVSRLRRNR